MLQAIDAAASVDAIERALRAAEDGTYCQVISIATGLVRGREMTLVTLRPGATGGVLSLVEVDGTASLAQQELQVCARRERGRRRLLGYGSVWVAGRRVNVAAYRG
jgi:hypothetical protein